MNLNNTTPIVYTVPQVAEILKIGRNSAYNLIASGTLKCVRIGKTIRVTQDALNEYLKKSTC